MLQMHVLVIRKTCWNTWFVQETALLPWSASHQHIAVPSYTCVSWSMLWSSTKSKHLSPQSQERTLLCSTVQQREETPWMFPFMQSVTRGSHKQQASQVTVLPIPCAEAVPLCMEGKKEGKGTLILFPWGHKDPFSSCVQFTAMPPFKM